MTFSFSTAGLNAFLDRFIPPSMAADREVRQHVRMFLISHLFGPFIGNVIPIAIYFLDPTPSYEIAVLAISITGFWVFPILLRFFGHYYVLAMISIQNLLFCILWSCFFYGGVKSPTLAWILSIPLLSFFYLGAAPRLRLVALGMFVVNFAAFYALYATYGHAPDLDPGALQGLGMISTLAAAMYVSMMALIYAKVLANQGELEQEMHQHLATLSELRRATEEAERAGKAKAEFLARMSHELRTPLNAIVGFSQILIEEGAADGDPDAADDLDRIQAAGRHLLDLVNDVLELSRIEANKVEFVYAPTDLSALLTGLVGSYADGAAEKETRIELSIAGGLEQFETDAARVRQILTQIVDNAVKFTRGGVVSISAGAVSGGRRVRIDVRDTGVGIEPDRLPTVFELFSRGGDRSGGEYDGTGIGLALARKLCRLMRGDITVRSELGRGSVFTVELPMSRAEEVAPEAVAA